MNDLERLGRYVGEARKLEESTFSDYFDAITNPAGTCHFCGAYRHPPHRHSYSKWSWKFGSDYDCDGRIGCDYVCCDEWRPFGDQNRAKYLRVKPATL